MYTLLKPFTIIGDAEISLYKKLFQKRKLISKTSNPMGCRKVVEKYMKENEKRTITITKIANGCMFEIQQDIWTGGESGGMVHVTLNKTFQASSRSRGVAQLEKWLGEFGAEIKKKLGKEIKRKSKLT